EETLMEIWSLTRVPDGTERDKPMPPEPWAPDDARWPPIPRQDFSNLPRQQRGLHAKGFEYMRLSEMAEGHISNFHRTIDLFLAGTPTEQLLRPLREINLNPLERPIVDIETGP
ncbi:MAG TPA: aromatic ring-hydroxylating dioxygenase subunit alpha, partial [Acidimicrobiia bacterium]|nr:aromatic ring-hydroxylating dioxygenase subunit alpha [Acidimicrobiia bacterium]